MLAAQTLESFQPPVPTTAEPQTETLLSQYATEEEIAAVRAACTAQEVTRADVIHVRTALNVAERKLQNLSYSESRQMVRAVARALGDPEPERDEPTESRAEVTLLHRGLSARLKDAEEAEKESHGKFRAALHNLLRACAERCAADYMEATRQQAWCHQQLSIAQQFIGQVRPVIDHASWSKYAVPGSEHLSATRGKSREEYFIPLLMSADRLTATISAETGKLRANGRELFGEWPL